MILFSNNSWKDSLIPKLSLKRDLPKYPHLTKSQAVAHQDRRARTETHTHLLHLWHTVYSWADTSQASGTKAGGWKKENESERRERGKMLTERRDGSRVETKDDFPLMWQMHTTITGPLRDKKMEEVNIPAIFMPFSLWCRRKRER